MPVSFATGALVEVRGERWLLSNVAAHGSATVLTLEGRDRDNARQRLRVIDPFDRPRPISSAKPIRRPRRAVLRAALGAIVDARSATGLWTAANASIDLLAYQLEPALAVLSGATRVLLADAVGLGKTIQAGLILSELRERGWIERALVVCPAGLRDTWAAELAARFGIRTTILDQMAIAERIASLPPGVNPWSGHAVAIASIDFIKRDEVLAALAAEPIDLLIADEAHHLTPGTDRGAAVSRLASRATWCVMVSATPHSGDEAAFDYLKNIGSHGEAMTIFRRGRRDVGLTAARRSHVLAITPTLQEASLFAALDQYTHAIWRERGRIDHAVRLIAITLARRAASSARAIERTLSRRLALLGTAVERPAQPLLPWDEEEDADREEDAVLATPGLESGTEERATLGQLIGLARECVAESKLRRLQRLLRRLREPAVIFTEYRDSVETLVDALRSSHRVGAIHGGVPTDSRRSIVDMFNAGELDVLVATDAAGEGLNLHHRCRLVIDLELPWNPLRLEQRIGRVDRLGQRRTVHAIRMIHPGTIEQRVLDHLRLREQRAADALERHHVTEASIANAIFQGEAVTGANPASIATIRVAAATGEQSRLVQQRRVHVSGARGANGLSWTPPRNGRPSAIVVLTRATLSNDSGAIVCDRIEARSLALRAVRNRRASRQLIEHERRRESSPGVELDAAVVPLDQCRALIGRRIRAIRDNAAAYKEAQSSLFDRRAEATLTAHQQSLEKLNRALSRTLHAIAPPARERTRIEVIAAWPERRR